MRNATLIVWASLCLAQLACASSSLRQGETQPLTQNGREVGTIKQLENSEREYSYAPTGRLEQRWTESKNQMKIFERFDPATGRIRSRSHYLQGRLNHVEVFNGDGSVRGIVSYPDGQTARTVELPKRGKLVEFVTR
ncbi:MAG: hypothetical protein JSR44_02990 [Spirochaetes bacterium]|nr:hypothetical protein [Spirochaetota bacterium]